MAVPAISFFQTHSKTMKATLLATRKFDLNAVTQALNDMRNACGGGDIPARLVRATARLLKLTPAEFAEAAARLNRPFATDHVR